MSWRVDLRMPDYLCPKCGEIPNDIEPLDSVMVMVTCVNGHTWNTFRAP
jgi:hypothetical protein